MKLRINRASPFARKARIIAREAGITAGIGVPGTRNSRRGSSASRAGHR